MDFKALMVLLGILVGVSNGLECSGNTGLVLVSDADNTFTSKITFDDQGWIESFYWVSSQDGPLNLTANGTSVRISGSSCELGGGSYFSYINSEYWKGSDPWINSQDLPNIYMTTTTDTTDCAMEFDPPIRSFVAYTNSFNLKTCSFFIYDVDGNQFDCSNNCPINAGSNNYQLRGFVGNKPIHKIVWANAYTALDNILYELWCPDNNYKNDGITEYCDYCSSNPCTELATCLNNSRSLTCTCPEGYSGDGIGPNGCQVISPPAPPVTSEPVTVDQPVSDPPANQPITATPNSAPTGAPKGTSDAKASSATRSALFSASLLVFVALL